MCQSALWYQHGTIETFLGRVFLGFFLFFLKKKNENFSFKNLLIGWQSVIVKSQVVAVRSKQKYHTLGHLNSALSPPHLDTLASLSYNLAR